MALKLTRSDKKRLRINLAGFYEKIEKLTRLHRILICVGVFALMGGGFYYFVYTPQKEVLDKARAELKKETERLNSYKASARSLKQWEEKMAEVSHAFHLATRALPDKKELPSLLTGISVAASQAGLTVLLFQPDPVVNKEFYMEIPVSMRLEGNFHQAADFFYQVSRLGRIVNIGSIAMKQARNEPGLLDLTCKAVTYMFVEEPVPAPAPAKGAKPQPKKKKG
jgi:type IV pilus assembly protein PilO